MEALSSAEPTHPSQPDRPVILPGEEPRGCQDGAALLLQAIVKAESLVENRSDDLRFGDTSILRASRQPSVLLIGDVDLSAPYVAASYICPGEIS